MGLSQRRDRIFHVWEGRGAACAGAELSQGVHGKDPDPAGRLEILTSLTSLTAPWAQPGEFRVTRLCWASDAAKESWRRETGSPGPSLAWIPAHPSQQAGLVFCGHWGIFLVTILVPTMS